jgi:CheY-like chemotaxis protein
MTNHRIRVLVGGDIYANRALVRPFLEDDGYELVGEAHERSDLMPQVIGRQPDAIVVDEALLSTRHPDKALQRIRRAAPDAKLVVVTAAPTAAAFADADATLESGLSIAALTALLGRLFAERPPRTAVSAGAVAAVTHRGAASEPTPEPRGSVARFVATIGVPLAVVWSLIVLMTTGGDVALPRADTSDLHAGGVAVTPITDGPLAGARDSLDRLLHAIQAGNSVLATEQAEALMEARTSAIAFGYPTGELDAEIESGLAAVVGLLSPNATGSLAAILGALFREIQDEPTTNPGGGSGVILGTATGSGGGTSSILTGGGGGNGNDDEGEAAGGNHGKEVDGGGGGDLYVLAPGDGRAWGHSHKESREDAGGPPPSANGNGPPPWANGHAREGDGGSDASEHRGHARGHAYGHAKNGHGKHRGDE